jgi:HlyD family secretion protein
MKKRRTALFIVVAILTLIVVVVALNFTLRGNRYDTAIPVRTHVTARGKLEDRVSGNGTFKPQTAVNVTAQVSGEVSSIHVSANSFVAKGDLLVSIRDDDYVLAAQKAHASLVSTRNSIHQSLVTLRAQYRNAAATLRDAQNTYDDNTSLFDSQSISEDAFNRSSDALESAKIGLQSIKEQLDLRSGYPLDADPPLTPENDAEIIEASPEVEQALLSLKSAQNNIERCSITAPIYGTVTDVRPSVGDMIAPATPIVRIESLTRMLAEIQIDEVDIGKIQVGQPAEIASDSLIGQILQGVVYTIAPTVTSLGSTRASLVDVRVDRGSLVLRSGASCTAKITTSIKQDVLVIPLSGFVTEENVSYLYLLKPTGRKNAGGVEVFLLSKVRIDTGVSDVSFVEVTSGLSDGDRIAVGNLNLLRDGIMVTSQKD